jgi:phospholipase D-like protein
MQTQAYFDSIQQQIINQIKSAKHSVFVAVAWLTDNAIFTELCNRAKNGITVELLLVNDAINNDLAPFDHMRLEACGGKVFFIPPQIDGAIMHHKFCIIDDCTIITGSYNWSRKARLNDENIVITSEACELGAQFKKEFDSIKCRIAGTEKETIIDFNKIIKRLEVIKNFAALEEKDEIASQIKKLKDQVLPPEVNLIVLKLENGQFTDALKLTDAFIRDKNRIAIYDDVELFGLQLELRSLELQLNALENELVETEKLVHEFLVRHTKELGKLIIELLELRRVTAKTKEEKAEAEQDEEAYRQGYEANKDTVIPELTVEEKKDLNKIYREASMLCHPDRFANEPPEKQKQAEEMFKKLGYAYSNNDTKSVQDILQKLKNGILSVDPVNAPSKKDIIKVTLETLKNKAVTITQKIKELKETEAYTTAANNTDWDAYFADAKVNLQKQIESLKVQSA